MTKHILIISADTPALVMNWALAGLRGVKTTVVTRYQTPAIQAEYINGPVRRHGDSPLLREMLAELDHEIDTYKLPYSELRNGELVKPKRLSYGSEPGATHRRLNASRTDAIATVNGIDRKLAKHYVGDTLWFDTRDVTNQLAEFASPVRGSLASVRGREATIKRGNGGVLELEVDGIMVFGDEALPDVPPETTTLIHVDAPLRNDFVDMNHFFTPELEGIARISYSTASGQYVCETRGCAADLPFEDLDRVFVHGFDIVNVEERPLWSGMLIGGYDPRDGWMSETQFLGDTIAELMSDAATAWKDRDHG